MLPKFLLADNSQEKPDTIFIIHTQSPRCIIQGEIEDLNENQQIHWIDQQPDSDKEADLIAEADAFYEAELENQEDLYDEEFDD